MIRLILKYLAALLAATALVAAVALAVMALSTWRRAVQALDVKTVSIPAGKFLMGCSPGDEQCGADEPAAHWVELAAFKIDEFPVTNAAYRKCVEAAICTPPHLPEGLGDFWDALKPVTGVTWKEAGSYCAWRGGRLPSEAQWERAARGTEGYVWPWGDRFDAGRVCAGIPPRRLDGPCPVDRFPEGASPDNVREMSGNVWEWTSDPYRPSSDPGDTVSHRQAAGPQNNMVLKGGSWMERESASLRASKLNAAPENAAAFNVGFRCAYP
jgi:formylglycine-generating enzyme required for sulfatase activity